LRDFAALLIALAVVAGLLFAWAQARRRKRGEVRYVRFRITGDRE
jgi:hypothetical protein